MKLLRRCIPYRSILRNYSTKEKDLIDVSVDEKSGIATINLQRPPLNNMNLELLTELSTALTVLEQEKSRGIILKSSLEKIFSAGIDFAEMYKPQEERVKKFWTTFQDVWIKLYGHSAPTVACIHGHTPAGGCILALSCEYRVMVNNGKIGLNEIHMGTIAPSWFIDSMENIIGRRQTELALVTGKMYTTEDALKIGMIDEIAEDRNEAFLKSEAFCKQFANISYSARANTKKLIRKSTIQALIDRRQQDLDECYEDAISEETQRGLELFMDSLKKKN